MRPRIYLDANVFIDAFENIDTTPNFGRDILDLARNYKVVAVLSELVVAELLVKPLQLGDVELCASYELLLDSTEVFETKPVDRNVLVEAAKVRAKQTRIKMPDAIHIATAQLNNCAAFVTADKRLTFLSDMIFVPLDASALDAIRALA